MNKILEVKTRAFSGDQGFTLIEIMIVIIIIGLLASLVAPKFFGKVDKAKVKTTKAQIELLGAALDSYRLDNGAYPSTEQGLEALRTKPKDLNTWDGPYLPKKIPLDAWGKEYHYKSPGENGPYDLFSYGRDGVAGGKDYVDKDIVSWE